MIYELWTQTLPAAQPRNMSDRSYQCIQQGLFTTVDKAIDEYERRYRAHGKSGSVIEVKPDHPDYRVNVWDSHPLGVRKKTT